MGARFFPWSPHRGLLLLLLGNIVMHVPGLFWGLPASDGWDNDGIAPRDVIPGIFQTFHTGDFYTYPPLQLLGVFAASLPASLLGLVTAPSRDLPSLISHFVGSPTMSIMAFVARLLTMLMAVGIVVAVHELGTTVAGRRAGLLAALAASVGVPFTYYAQTSNLDVPYLFWGSLSLLFLSRTLLHQAPSELLRAALSAAFGVCTKDQAYALVVIPFACVLVAVVLARRGPLRTWLLALVPAVVVVLLVDGVLVNPTGFAKRLSFLMGPASQDFAQYAADVEGRKALVVDTLRAFTRHYPGYFFIPLAMGLVRACFATRRLLAFLPLLAAASFTLLFNLAARRVEERFTLPQMLFAAFYIGLGLDGVLGLFMRAKRAGPVLAFGGAALFFAPAAEMANEVNRLFLDDPRYEAEAYLQKHVAPGEGVEVYGLNVYLPRFPKRAKVVRVEPEPVSRRNPLQGVTEIEAPYADIATRNPRFAVVSGCYSWRYFPRGSGDGGRILPPTQVTALREGDTVWFFRALFEGRLGYKVALRAEPAQGRLPVLPIHASLGCPMWIFEREPSGG